MTWFGWVLAVLEVFGTVKMIAENKVEPRMMAITAIAMGVIVYCIFAVGTGHI